LHSFTTVESVREAALNSTPGRLKRVVQYGAALGLAGIDAADAAEAIEDTIWAGGALPIDRASQVRAWELTRERALYAYANAPDVADMAKYRAARDAPKILDTLCEGATPEDFARAIAHAEPLLAIDDALDLARAVASSLARPPIVQRGPAPGADPFAETRTLPSSADLRRHERAAHLIGVTMGNLSGLHLATFMGEPVQPTATESPIAFDLDHEPGLLGDIARWSQTFAFRPVREFAQPAALAVLSALFGRRWATPTGLGLNLYQVAIAETGGGKDALVGSPRALLSAAGFRHLLGPGDFSSDAAIEKSLRARPAQLMPLDEFGKLAQAMMGRNAPSFAKLAAKALLEIYPRSQPGSEWTGKARASDEHDAAADPIHSPTLSLLGVSTPEGFFEGMCQATLDDGFLNRLTVIRAGQAGDRQRDPARLTPPPPLIEALRAAYEASGPAGNLAGAAARNASAVPHIRFAQWADEGAVAAIEAVEAWEDNATDSGRRGVAGRAAEQTQKIATLRALAREPGAPRVTAEDVRWAFTMVESSIEAIDAGAREMMAGSEFEALCQAIERAVVVAGEAGLAWSHLVRAKGVSRADDRMVDAAVKRLETAERVWRIGPGGRRLRARREDERVAG